MIEYKVKVYDNRDKHWYLNDKLHREDGPAVECANGNKYWYRDGKLHREDGPAEEHTNGYKAWYLNGRLLTEEEFLNRTKPKPCKNDLKKCLKQLLECLEKEEEEKC